MGWSGAMRLVGERRDGHRILRLSDERMSGRTTRCTGSSIISWSGQLPLVRDGDLIGAGMESRRIWVKESGDEKGE